MSLRIAPKLSGFSTGVLATAVGLHILALLSLELGYLNTLFNDAENRLGRGADFFAVYYAGENFLSQVSVYAGRMEDSSAPYAYPFRYLPSVAWTFGAGLNLVSASTAYWVWIAFNEVLLVVNVVLTLRHAPNPATRVLGACMWLLFTPFYLELYMGQFSFVMASLFFWMGLLLYHGRMGGVALSWTATILVKSNSLLFLPMLLRLGLIKQTAAGIAFAALLNLPYFLLVSGSWEYWSSNLRTLRDGSTVSPHAGNLGLPSLLALPTSNPDDYFWERAGTWLAQEVPWGMIFVAIAVIATFLAPRTQAVRLLALWTCTYFLIFGEVWEHHYVMVLPILVLLVLFDAKLRPAAMLAWLFIALPSPYVLWQTSAPSDVNFMAVDPQTYWSTGQIYVHHLSKLLPVVILWAMLVYNLSRGETASLSAGLRTNVARLRRGAEALAARAPISSRS